MRNKTWCRTCRILEMVENREYNKKLTLDVFQSIAKSRGGECLSAEYVGAEKHLLFKCSNPEHPTFSMCPKHVYEHWCSKCGDDRVAAHRFTPIEEIHALAISRNGKCLSEHYTSWKAGLLWQCACGNTWRARLYESAVWAVVPKMQ